MADQDNPHFNKIFWYIIMITVIALGYATAVTFVVVPKDNSHIVDVTLGFLFGTLVSAGVGYLLGGNPVLNKKNTQEDTQVNQMDVDADKVNVAEK